MKSNTIKWENFCGVKLNDKDIKDLLKCFEIDYRMGRRRVSTGDILIEVTPYNKKIAVEVYRRIKCGTCDK